VIPAGPLRPVGEDALEAQLSALAAQCSDPTEGLFGPGSVFWRTQREALMFMGGARAAILQTAHPWIAQGVYDHSRTKEDPIGRFHRTFVIVFSIVYGSLDQAFAQARAVHRIHARIKGTMPETLGPFPQASDYYANEAHALLWVHATLWETSMTMWELVFPPLSPQDKAQYYEETKRFAACFGVPADLLPPDWESFEAYNHAQWENGLLTIGHAGRDVLGHLFLGRGSGGKRVRALPKSLLAITAKTLPPMVREQLDMPYGPREERLAERTLARIRRLYPLMPTRLRHVGPYQEAQGRLKGRTRTDLLTRGLNRLWVGRSRLVG